jgi:hypothetical protein
MILKGRWYNNMVKYSFYFEPEQPITIDREFTDELIKYCKKENKDLTILHEGMEPVVMIDGQKYICMLEQPRTINIPFLPAFYINSYGFKWVYIYKYD